MFFYLNKSLTYFITKFKIPKKKNFVSYIWEINIQLFIIIHIYIKYLLKA